MSKLKGFTVTDGNCTNMKECNYQLILNSENPKTFQFAIELLQKDSAHKWQIRKRYSKYTVWTNHVPDETYEY